MTTNLAVVSESIPKSEFIEVYHQWRAGRNLILIKTKQIPPNLKSYLRGLNGYFRDIFAPRRHLNIGHHEINITICKVNALLNQHQELESHTENLNMATFDKAFDSMALALEAEERDNPFRGNIELCVVHEFTPMLQL